MFVFVSVFRFVIFFFCIDVPDVGAVADTVYDVVYDFERGAHRMVDVVVTVLTVSADTVEVVDAVEPVDQSIDFLVGVEVSGISFFNRLECVSSTSSLLSIMPILMISSTAKSENS